MLRLDANEGRCLLSENDLREILSPEIARRYPVRGLLEGPLAERLGLPASCVLATAGADDAIDRAVRTLAGPGGLVMSTHPGFVEFLAAAQRSSAMYASISKDPFGLSPYAKSARPSEKSVRSSSSSPARQPFGRRAVSHGACGDSRGVRRIRDDIHLRRDLWRFFPEYRDARRRLRLLERARFGKLLEVERTRGLPNRVCRRRPPDGRHPRAAGGGGTAVFAVELCHRGGAARALHRSRSRESLCRRDQARGARAERAPEEHGLSRLRSEANFVLIRPTKRYRSPRRCVEKRYS